eukprot:95847-Amphidinium_carterae.2
MWIQAKELDLHAIAEVVRDRAQCHCSRREMFMTESHRPGPTTTRLQPCAFIGGRIGENKKLRLHSGVLLRRSWEGLASRFAGHKS